MANPQRGESLLKIGNKEYTLKYDCNAKAEFEASLGETMPLIGKRMEKAEMGFRDLRAMLWAGLRRYHRNITIEQAGDLIDTAGQDIVAEAVLSSWRNSLPIQNGDGADPPKAAGTG